MGKGSGNGDTLINPHNRRAKVVAFSGKELFDLFKKKIFAVGLWPAMLRKEKERKEREKREEEARKKAEEAKKNGLPPLPSGPPPVPGVGKLKLGKKGSKGPGPTTRQLHWDLLKSTEGTIWEGVNPETGVVEE